MLNGRALALMACPALIMANAAPQPIDLPGDRLFPESLSIDGDIAYVGSMTGGAVKADLRRGRAVQWLKPGDFGTASIFGVVADHRNRMVWVCSNDMSCAGIPVAGGEPGSWLKGLDLHSGRPRISLALSGDQPTCNDIALAGDGSVFVSDSGASRVLRWRPGQAALEVWAEDPVLKAAPDLGGLDGLAFGRDGNLYANNVRDGAFYRIERRADGSAGRATRLMPSRPLAGPDGMRSLGNLDFAVAEGGGKVSRLRVAGDTVEVRTLAEGIDNPTGVGRHGSGLWYVQGQFGSLFRTGAPPPRLPFRLTPIPTE